MNFPESRRARAPGGVFVSLFSTHFQQAGRAFHPERVAISISFLILGGSHVSATVQTNFTCEGNPLFRNQWTADPAPLVVGDALYVYAGRDDAHGGQMFHMPDWVCYSTKDLKTWTSHGSFMKPTDFKWAVADAWAAQVVEKDGKFYFYTTVQHDNTKGGKAIGVAVSDCPTGPFVDARGSALVTEDMTPTPNFWDDIDPTVLIDDKGDAWMAWGNPNCFLAKLKPNMTDLDGPIRKIHVPNYTEGPWLDQRNGLYYLFYPSFAHQGQGEKICYATAKNITGPWTYHGVLTGEAEGSYTIHPGIAEFNGESLFFYHNATLALNGEGGALGRRAVCAEYLFYNPDGTIQPITQTKEGISVPPKRPEVKSAPVASKPAVSDSGVTVKQDIGADPETWPGKPVLTTVGNPYRKAIPALGFNHAGGRSNLGQTFKLERDLKLQGIALYAGDGMGATEQEPVTLAIHDLGTSDAVSDTYTAAGNLLDNGKGLKIAYQPQARGLLRFSFSDTNQPTLKAGHVYAFELQGKPGSLPLFWRSSGEDVFDGGAAYGDRKRIVDGEKSRDFAMALYGILK